MKKLSIELKDTIDIKNANYCNEFSESNNALTYFALITSTNELINVL